MLCWWLQCKHSYQYFVYFNSIFNSIYLYSIYIFQFNNFISFPFCVVSTTAMWTLMPIFCFNFNFIFNSFSVASFSFYIFLLNNFIFFIFVLCWQLQCKHSCQYFFKTLISLLVSFSVTSFGISIFLFNNFILYYFYCCID